LPIHDGTPWFKIAVGAVLSGQAMLLGLAVNLAPPAETPRWLLHGALLISTLAALAILGRPLLSAAFEEIRQRRASIELMFLLGIAGALGASIHSTLSGLGAVYYEVVAVLLTVYSVGKTLGAASRARAVRESQRLAETFEQCRRVAPNGSEATVRVAEVCPGDQIRVLPGDPVPVDGRILRGQAFVCETPLTGEPFPVVRRAGDMVFAGSYSEDGELLIAATAPGNRRQLDGLLRALETARAQPSRLQAQADRIVRWFLPIVLVLSLASFLFWGLRVNWATGLFNGLAVLLVACPCAMGLATPVALWNGLATLAARGLIVRGGNVIDRLAMLDQIVFDKTGTLSEEDYSLIDLATTATDRERQTLIAQLRAVQTATSHPVGRAFRSLGAATTGDWEVTGSSSNAPLGSYPVCSLKAVPALGVEAWIESSCGDEHHLRVGNRELMTDLSAETRLGALLHRGPADQVVYVEVDGRLQAIASVREKVRVSAGAALDWLQRAGIACSVMTGDRTAHALSLIDVADVQGGLTPQSKADRVAALGRAGRQVGFVGDGVNDAPAMREAAVSIALAHGAGVTTANADVVLCGGDLRLLPWAVELCRKVRQSIASNLVFAAAYNTAGMILAATGLLHPVAAALLMVVSSFTVSWRALRCTEDSGVCCGLPGLTIPAGASRPAERQTQSAGQQTDARIRQPGQLNLEVPAQPWAGRTQQICGGLVMAQTPFLIYLGQLTTLPAVALMVVLLITGLIIMRSRPQNPEWHRVALMTFAMLGFGNWGMILGWWADSGFAPAMAGCPHCVADGFSLTAFTHMPWMNAGMLLLGVPPMLLDTKAKGPGLSRLAFGLLSSAGMVWGMSFGDYVFMKWFGSLGTQRFLLSFSGMTIGMLLGMLLLCEFTRALSLAVRAAGKSG
jgi:heavy metal translocating P-type ATPase